MAARIVERAGSGERLEAYVASGRRDRGPRVPGRGRVAHLGDDRGRRHPRPRRHARRRTRRLRVGGLARERRRRRGARGRPGQRTIRDARRHGRVRRRPTAWCRVSLVLEDPSLPSFPTDRKIALAIELERAARAADPRVRQIDDASYGDAIVESALASTTGIRSSARRSMSWVSVAAIANGSGAGPDRLRVQGGERRRRPRRRVPRRATRSCVRRACSGRPSRTRRTARWSSTRA